jgi:hypothetical protein
MPWLHSCTLYLQSADTSSLPCVVPLERCATATCEQACKQERGTCPALMMAAACGGTRRQLRGGGGARCTLTFSLHTRFQFKIKFNSSTPLISAAKKTGHSRVVHLARSSPAQRRRSSPSRRCRQHAQARHNCQCCLPV